MVDMLVVGSDGSFVFNLLHSGETSCHGENSKLGFGGGMGCSLPILEKDRNHK